MRRDTQAVTATIVGAVLGGLAGYVLFSERGRTWRRRLQPRIDDVIRELHELRNTVTKAGDGWRLLTDAVPDPSAPDEVAADEPAFARRRQQYPF